MASERFTVEFLKYHVYTRARVNTMREYEINTCSLPVLLMAR